MKDERDFAAQVDAIENFVTQKFNIIVVAPADSKAMVTPIAKALKAGVKVINIDVELDQRRQEGGRNRSRLLRPRQPRRREARGRRARARSSGRAARSSFSRATRKPTTPCSARRASMDSVAEGKLQLLDSKTAHWETEEANTLMTNFLTQYHDIQGVMAANDSMALGVVKALDAAGLSGKIQVVGFDNIPAVQPLVKSGKMLATVEQFGADMAALGIQYGTEGIGGRELHRLGQDAGQVDHGEGPTL